MSFVTIKNKENGNMYHCILLERNDSHFFVAVKFPDEIKNTWCSCSYDYWELIL